MRVIGQCMGEGQAAATAAAIAVARSIPMADVDPGELRARLTDLGIPV